ncbi:MAG: hypothetical protein KBD78_00215 [Oligoflexales bacterium]|nr:hypothetical protein [Oligoflexales bacterium]
MALVPTDQMFAAQKSRNFLKKKISLFFEERGFLDVETPVVVQAPGIEVHQQYFSTKWRYYDGQEQSFFLRSSPELHMKRLLSEKMPRIYQIGKCFRNGGEYSQWHHPEFTMLEWYEVGASLNKIVADTEELIRTVWEEFRLNNFSGSKIEKNKLPPLKRISVFDAVREFVGIVLVDGDVDLAKKAIQSGVISVKPNDDFETAYFKILIEKIEPKLEQLEFCVLFDFPPSQSALSKVINGRAQRFEFYLFGVELSNGYLEEMSEAEVTLRLKTTNKNRLKLGYDEIPRDENFFASLREFSSEVCGNALGFDRLLALILSENSIKPLVGFESDYSGLLN